MILGGYIFIYSMKLIEKKTQYALRSIFSNELLRSLSSIDNSATAEAHYHEVIIAERTAAPVKQV